MNLAPPKNPNYCATVVALKSFADLAGCDNIKAALIFGYSVIVSKTVQTGDLGLFFPAETALSARFLSENNLYRKPECGNVDPKAKGFFEQHGRVRTVKFRGHKSEGFWIPLSSLAFLTGQIFEEGATLDTIGDVEICRKYVPNGFRPQPVGGKAKTAKLEDSIVDGQFRFHFDTENLRRNANKIMPEDWISISDKWHGTSVVIGKVLVKRTLSWKEKLAQFFSIEVKDSVYGLTYSSRRVIKAVNGVAKNENHFYTEDIWGIVAKEVADCIPDGFTLYGEIVGFTPEGAPIQGRYQYGCSVGAHKFLVYRVTLTTPGGQVVELPWCQMREFCAKYALQAVPELFYGKAGDILPCIGDASGWHDALLDVLQRTYVNDGDCPYNAKGTPAEGIVLRIDRLHECGSYKLKNFRFLEQESKVLDTGVLDTETAESEEVAQ